MPVPAGLAERLKVLNMSLLNCFIILSKNLVSLFRILCISFNVKHKNNFYKNGSHGRIRTDTVRILSPLSPTYWTTWPLWSPSPDSNRETPVPKTDGFANLPRWGLARALGIEPRSSGLEADTLPLCYTRK